MTQTKLKRYDCPDWNRNREIGRMIAGPTIKSTYQRDFGTFGSNPLDKEYINKYGIVSSTSRPLF